jgi:iron-sulfur cluster repair protein YtfE (RIC family)
MAAVLSPEAIEGQLLDQEHRQIRAGLSSLQEGIDRAHAMSRSDAIDRVVRTLAWLRRDLLPHAAWEEAWLYPHLDRAAGTPWATQALRLQHEQIRELAAALEREFAAAEVSWSAEEAFQLTVAMTRLEALISAHLTQEQWFVGPLLEMTGHADGRRQGGPPQ